MNEVENPISRIEEDLLNRNIFSKNISNAILNWRHKESIIIGLYGPWGYGKTTILNFIKQELLESTDNLNDELRPKIVKFNPWNYCDENQLVNGFFSELRNQLKGSSIDTKYKISSSIEDFWKCFSFLEEVPKVGWLAKIIHKISTKEKSFNEAKQQIFNCFSKLQNKIIIFIDDIDRLNDNEIRTLFKLIKNNIDFPNIIYLLAFDREIVEKALSTEQSGYGRKYLEKIVQVGFDIPKIEKSILRNIIISKIESVVLDFDKSFTVSFFEPLYQSGLLDYFDSIRDIKRYINSLSGTLGIISGEINITDFLALEALRVFSPNIYHCIPQNWDIFINDGYSSTEQSQLKIDKEKFNSIISSIEEYKEPTRKIIAFLFPQTSVYDNIFQTSYIDRDLFRKEMRICSKDFCEIYFLLKIPNDSISQKEIYKLINNTNSPSEFSEQLLAFDKKAFIVLNRIPDFYNPSKNSFSTICDGLLMFANYHKLEENNNWISLDTKAIFTIEKILQLERKEKSKNWINEKITNETRLYIITAIISDIEKNNINFFTKEEFSSFKNKLVKKFITQSRSKDFLQEKKIVYVLSRWSNWDKNKQNLEQFILKTISTNLGFVQFINLFVVESIEYNDQNQFIRKKSLDLESLQKFIPIDQVQSRLNRIRKPFLNKLTYEQLDGLKLLHESLVFPKNIVISNKQNK